MVSSDFNTGSNHQPVEKTPPNFISDIAYLPPHSTSKNKKKMKNTKNKRYRCKHCGKIVSRRTIYLHKKNC